MLLYKRKEEVHSMNENKRLLIFFISIVLVIAIILVIAFWPQADTTFACGVSADKDYSKLASINYKQYECLAEQNDKFAVAISDGLSDDEKKTLNEAAEKINVGIYYLSDEISNTDLNPARYDSPDSLSDAYEIDRRYLEIAGECYPWRDASGEMWYYCRYPLPAGVTDVEYLRFESAGACCRPVRLKEFYCSPIAAHHLPFA